MTEDASKVLSCIMSCEISLYTACYTPDKAVVPISNIVSLLKWTKYRVRKTLKELRGLERKAHSGRWSDATIYGMLKAVAIICKYREGGAE